MLNLQAVRKNRPFRAYKVFSVAYTTTALIACGVFVAALGIGEIRLRYKRWQEAEQKKTSTRNKIGLAHKDFYAISRNPEPQKANPYQCPYQSHFREDIGKNTAKLY